MSEFEIIERPIGGKRTAQTAESKAVIETLTSGKAVRVSFNGVTQATLTARFHSLTRGRNAKVRTRRDGDALIVWMEPKNAVTP